MSPASPPVQHTSTLCTPSAAYLAVGARALRRFVVGVRVDLEQAESVGIRHACTLPDVVQARVPDTAEQGEHLDRADAAQVAGLAGADHANDGVGRQARRAASSEA